MKTTNKLTIVMSVLLGVSMMTTSCSDKKEREALKQKTQVLEDQLAKRDSTFNEVMEVMSQVERQIDKIKSKENIVALKSQGDFSESDKDQIVQDMEAIDNLIANSTQTIQNLSSKLDKADVSLRSFKNRIGEMNKDLESRKEAISSLKESLIQKDVQIAQLSSTVGSLEARVDLQTETIDLQISEINDQKERMNTAYFAVGPEKRLEDKGIITKEGGFLWIGRTTELEENATRDQFVSIDIRDTDKLIVDSKKVELVTEHPSDSYEWVKEGDKVQYLSIKDPGKFWGISKYLVISTKG